MSTVTIAAAITSVPVLLGGIAWMYRISATSTRIADAVLGYTDKRTGTVNLGLSPQMTEIKDHQERIYGRLRSVEVQLDPDHKGGLTERLVSAEGNSAQILATIGQIREANSANTEAVRKALHDATQARAEARAPALIVGFQMNAYTRKVKEVLGHEGLPVDPIDVERLADIDRADRGD